MVITSALAIGEVVLVVGKLVGHYSGYASKAAGAAVAGQKVLNSLEEDKRKPTDPRKMAQARLDDDRDVRNFILNELNKSKPHLMNMMESAYRNDDFRGSDEVKRVMDEMQLFCSEAEITAIGKDHAFKKDKRLDDEEKLEDLIRIDYDLVTGARNASETCDKLDELMLQGEKVDLPFEMAHLRGSILGMRKRLKDRNTMLKEVK